MCGADVSGQQGHVATAYVAPGSGLRPTGRPGQSSQLDALRRVTLGEYDIRGELGQGGMATVYLAHDVALDRKVAIKVMSTALFSMPGMVERFKREARTAASLSHPNIIPIYAVKESADLVYFVMKFIAGRSLESVLRAAGALPLPLVRAVLYQVGEALSYAHQHSVVHRDIKPANIMLDTGGWVVVTDFGIAKVAESTGLTMTGATIGTPSYMSPEQCEAKQALTGASDQYSLGIVAYEMLTGRVPFVADTTVGLLYAQVHEPPPPVAELRPDCPPDTAEGLMRMLAKTPTERWPDVGTAVGALGGAPLRRDDPIRTQLAALAQAQGDADVRRLATPISPVPRTRAARLPPPKASRARPRIPTVVWVGSVAALAAAGSWWIATRPRSLAGSEGAASPSAAAPAPPAESAATRAAAGRGALGPGSEPGTRRAVTAERDARFARSRARALSERARAESAGATPAQLAPGDRAARQADALAERGRSAAALAQLAVAGGAWNRAEQQALGQPEQRRGTAAPAADGASAWAAIEQTVTALARALESRNLGQVRQVYPSLTAQQAQEWSQFFTAASNLRVSLRVTSLEQLGERANADIEGSYDYRDSETGRQMRRLVAFRGTFERSAAGDWRLTLLR
jgi:tRNA A-37 threonylcarbamoyl transferase component Bud32